MAGPFALSFSSRLLLSALTCPAAALSFTAATALSWGRGRIFARLNPPASRRRMMRRGWPPRGAARLALSRLAPPPSRLRRADGGRSVWAALRGSA